VKFAVQNEDERRPRHPKSAKRTEQIATPQQKNDKDEDAPRAT
jgi:hypothetical protein